ncbi:MAG: hypothetical protein HQK49_20920 [Oligoflexia bacterium]|nr:hypothetical protein [Oligoflexia bacterium]
MIPKISSNNSSPYKNPFEEQEDKKQKKNKSDEQNNSEKKHKDSNNNGLIVSLSSKSSKSKEHREHLIEEDISKMNNHPYYKGKGISFLLLEDNSETIIIVKIAQTNNNQSTQRISSDQFRALVQRIEKGYHDTSHGDLVNVKC